MDRPTYYCEIVANDYWEFPPAVYAIPFRHEYTTKIKRCISFSSRVWVQGTRGGVKIIKNYFDNDFGYVTNKPESMKKFMWAKLKAKSLANYS